MDRQGLQEMVRSIFSDESIRCKFAKDPQSVISHYNLTAAEKKAALSPRLKTALVSANSAELAEINVLDSWF
jgi:hypothetical protein